METHDPDVEHRLDRQTGEIVFLCDPGLTDVDEDTRERVEADPERYLLIAPVSSAEGWRPMREFVDQLPVGEARERLEAALHRGSPFRRFKDTLFGYPSVRQAWFCHHEQAVLAIAQAWLEPEGIEPDWQKWQNSSTG
jgi:hypothetical protein